MKTKIRVGMILERDFPPDDRPEKEALSLIKAGYEVYLLCFTWQDRPLIENYQGIQIRRFRIKRQVYKKLSAAYLVFPFYKMIWQKQIDAFVKDYKLDIIHIHDLPMTDLVHKAAKKYKCQVVCDQHEYWSNWIINTAHYNTVPGRIIKYFSNWQKYERKNLKRAHLVLTVTESLRKLYMDEVGIDPSKIITVPNTPSKRIFSKQNIDPKISNKYKDHFVLFYAGAMDVLRGLDVVINALPALEKDIPNIRFVLAGRFSKGFDPLQMAEEIGVRHLLDYVGWLNVQDLPSYINASKICIFTPHPTHDEINNTIATKIYQYMAMGKPIITSHAKMMHDFIVDNKIGFAIDSYNAQDFSDCVKMISKNYSKVAREIVQNCEKLMTTESMFWEQTITPMLDSYKQLST